MEVESVVGSGPGDEEEDGFETCVSFNGSEESECPIVLLVSELVGMWSMFSLAKVESPVASDIVYDSTVIPLDITARVVSIECEQSKFSDLVRGPVADDGCVERSSPSTLRSISNWQAFLLFVPLGH